MRFIIRKWQVQLQYVWILAQGFVIGRLHELNQSADA